MPVVRDVGGGDVERMSDSEETDSSSSLSDSELNEGNDDGARSSDGGWRSPVLSPQSYECTANGTTNHTELAVVTDDAESMDLFAVSWRSRNTPTDVSFSSIFPSDHHPNRIHSASKILSFSI